MNAILQNIGDPLLREKVRAAADRIARCGSVLVALSGGVDSTLVLKLAAGTLNRSKVRAATASGEIFPAFEQDRAEALARDLVGGLERVAIDPLADPAFASNPPDRCYHCKKNIFSQLAALAEKLDIQAVLSGTNASDIGDYRPGLKAEEELGVVRPLLEAGLTKGDVRAASRALGLPTAGAPSMACLASRVPYHSEITSGKLSRIDRAEASLRALGFDICRVRDHDSVARVEVPEDRLADAMGNRELIVRRLHEAGYRYVSLDLSGFRSGSLNESLADADAP